MKRRVTWFILVLMLGAVARAEVTPEAVKALGVTEGKTVSNGFVFLDGRYLTAPYTVTRRGNGIYVNRFMVQESPEWATLLGAHRTKGKYLDEDGDFEIIADASADGDSPTDEVKKKYAALQAKIDAVRRMHEQALNAGCVLFFTRDSRFKVENNAQASKLMLALPKALEGASSAKQLQALLQQAGIFFVDLDTCAGLCRNPLNAQLVSARLAEFRGRSKNSAESSK